MKKAKTNKTNKPKRLNYENNGYKFAFEDKELQDFYILIFEHFKNYFPDLPEQKVISYADARSLTRGKDRKRLDEAEKIYTNKANTNNAKSEKHHKNVLFDKEIGGKTVNNWLKNLDNLKADIIKSGGGSFEANTVRFNFVYYDRGYGD